MMPDQKQQRKALLSSRRSLTKNQRQAFSQAITAKITASEAYQKASTCLLFAAMPDEVQTKELILDALKAGKCVCLPYITSKKESLMQAARIHSWDDLQEGAYGILSVREDRLDFVEPDELDFVLVPAVGMDKNGWRMGMGGGYYDRYLPRAVNAKRVCAIYSCQLLDAVIRDEYDAQADIVFTEKDSISIDRDRLQNE